jgi:hypothetical protein
MDCKGGKRCRHAPPCRPPSKVAGTLRRAVRRQKVQARSAVPSAVKLLPGFWVDGTWNVPTTLGGRHMECAYYSGWTAHGMCLLLWVDGRWNVPTTLPFVGWFDLINGISGKLRFSSAISACVLKVTLSLGVELLCRMIRYYT